LELHERFVHVTGRKRFMAQVLNHQLRKLADKYFVIDNQNYRHHILSKAVRPGNTDTDVEKFNVQWGLKFQ
jgi:hypothetical protein